MKNQKNSTVVLIPAGMGFRVSSSLNWEKHHTGMSLCSLSCLRKKIVEQISLADSDHDLCPALVLPEPKSHLSTMRLFVHLAKV